MYEMKPEYYIGIDMIDEEQYMESINVAPLSA